MSDQLNMGSGFSPIKMGIVAGLFAVTGAVAFSFMGASAPKPGQVPATSVASSPAATPAAAGDGSAIGADGSGAAAPADTATAMDANGAPNNGMTSAASSTAAAAPAAQPITAAAPAAQPASSTTAASQQAPATTTAAAAPAARATATPSSAGTVTAKADSGQSSAPVTADAMTGMAGDSNSAASADDAAAPAKKSVESSRKNQQPVAPPAPPATAVLHQWWKSSDAASFGVQFVGQAAESNSLVILFSKPIDPSAVGDKVRVLAADGKAVDLNWQRGNSPQVLVQNDLPPGRYTVMLDPATASMTGQNLGTSLYGPVYIQ